MGHTILQALGTATAQSHQAALPLDDTTVLLPLSTFVTLWSVPDHAKLDALHPSIGHITCLLEVPNASHSFKQRHVVVASATGHLALVALLDNNKLELLDTMDIKPHGFTDEHDYFVRSLALSHDGASVSAVALCGHVVSVPLLARIPGFGANVTNHVVDDIVATHIAYTPKNELVCVGPRRLPDNEVVDESDAEWGLAIDGDLLCPVLPGSRNVSCILYIPESNRIAVSRSDGSLYMLDGASSSPFEQLWTLDIKKNGLIRAMAGRDDMLAVPGLFGEVLLVNVNDGKVTHTQKDLPSGELRFVGFGAHQDHLWCVSNEGAVTMADMQTQETHTLAYHELAACALAWNPAGDMLATGDMAGNVMLWDCDLDALDTSNMDASTSKFDAMCFRHREIKLESGVRSMAFANDSDLVCGCFSGDLVVVSVQDSASATRMDALTGNGCITCVQFSDDGKLLAVGDSTGLLRIAAAADLSTVLNEVQAHEVGQEIWNVAWKPDGSAIATCSEDQTTCVWSLPTSHDDGDKGLELVTTLLGHTMAVTCVRWSLFDDAELLVTCSDDRQVLVFDPLSWDLVVAYRTKDLYVTYLAIHDHTHRHHVVCVTEDGWAYTFEPLSNTDTWSHRSKLHYGSIEGLEFHPTLHVAATVSSKCDMALFSLDAQPLCEEDA